MEANIAMRKYFVLLIYILLLASCSNKIYLHRIKVFLNASTTESRGRYMADNYHSFFGEKKGDGKDKAAALRSFLEWDAPLHPDIQVLHYSVKDNEWTVVFNEQNDFTKPIGFPGWKGTEIIRFNNQKQIEEMIYIPDENNPSYKKWLQPALEWLQKNKPADLNEVYKDGKLVQTNETAKKWSALLQDWKKQTGQKK